MQKKKRKGFTLLEILAVIAILGFLSVIIYPTVINILNQSKEDAYQIQLKEIEDAASKWTLQNSKALPKEENTSFTLHVIDLKRAGLLKLKLIDPRTNLPIPDDMEIVITRKNGKYIYVVKKDSGSKQEELVTGTGTIILSGLPYEYVEVKTAYTEKGAIAVDKKGNRVPDTQIQIVIKKNQATVNTVDTSVLAEYTITYFFTEDGKTISTTRKVKVRDTTAPILTIPVTTRLSNTDSKFNVMEGVSATDNYDGDITSKIITKGNVTLYVPGVYVISYEIGDSSGNKRTKKRTVLISGDICTPVKVTGSTKEGTATNKDVTLTAATLNGNAPEATSYQWQKLENDVWQNVAGATGRTLKLTTDVSTKFRVIYTQYDCYNVSNEYSVYIDKTPPACPTFTANIAASTWTASTANIKITPTSDTTKYDYLYSSNNGSSYSTAVEKKDVFTASYASTGKWKIRTVVKDFVGNARTCDSATYFLDKTAPSCTSRGGSGSWTNGNMTLYGDCKDNESGCKAATISKVFSSDISTNTASPGTIYDNVGNSTTCPGNQTLRIDKTAPTCTSRGGNSSWTNNNVILYGDCKDSGSGCKNATISKTFTSDINTNTASPGTIYDNAGNSATCAANQQVHIDKTPPSNLYVSGNPGCVEEPTQIKFSLHATETGSGIAKWQWRRQLTGGAFNDYANSATTAFNVPDAYKGERDHVTEFQVWDNAGNSSMTSSRFCIRKKPISIGGNAGRWQAGYPGRSSCDWWAAKYYDACPDNVFGNTIGKVDMSYSGNNVTFNWIVSQGPVTYVYTGYFVDFVIYNNGTEIGRYRLKEPYGEDWGGGSIHSGTIKQALGNGNYDIRIEGNSENPGFNMSFGTVKVG
ncbi:MAG: DUF5011 domain-containing protein [Bacilli bacterium]|nr:DUF5011 domain-containing protein [Bacilli bacterium]